MVKKLPLSDYRIIYFATHALVAGDIKGLGEPALALTLPVTPSTEDDGLLTASEVAELRLNADWVVLSACNTAAGDKPGPKRFRASPAPFSMPERGPCSSRTGTSVRTRRRAC